MRLKQLFGVVALLAVGLVACGPVEDDGQVGYPVRVVVDSPTWATVVLDVDYEVYSGPDFITSTGTLLTGGSVRDGETLEVEDPLFVYPGDEVVLHINFAINDEPFRPFAGLVKVEEDTTAVEISLTNREDLGYWIVGTRAVSGTEAPIEDPVDEPTD